MSNIHAYVRNPRPPILCTEQSIDGLIFLGLDRDRCIESAFHAAPDPIWRAQGEGSRLIRLLYNALLGPLRLPHHGSREFAVGHRCGNNWCVNPAHFRIDSVELSTIFVGFDRFLCFVPSMEQSLSMKRSRHFQNSSVKSFSGQTLVHRIIYQTYVGDPTGGMVCHRCGDASCLTPHHLYLGTHEQNTEDRKKHRAVTL